MSDFERDCDCNFGAFTGYNRTFGVRAANGYLHTKEVERAERRAYWTDLGARYIPVALTLGAAFWWLLENFG